MEARNCPKCGKVFTYINSPICPACEKAEEALFLLVRDYLKENPNESMSKISEETGVPTSKIIRYIKEGRLETTSGVSADIVCEHCGCPIKTGRYCEQCRVIVKRNVTEMFANPAGGGPSNKSMRMHNAKRL